jgi:hypothetical protein
MITQSAKLTKEMVELAARNGNLEQLRGQEINRLIRLRYSQSEENAVYRHKFNGTGNDEFATFDAYCEECKAKVDEQMARLKAELEEELLRTDTTSATESLFDEDDDDEI